MLLAYVLGAALAAQLVVWLLWPGGGVLDPAAVDLRTTFSTAELDRARSFRGPQTMIAIAASALQLAALAGLVWWVRRRRRETGADDTGRALGLLAVAGLGVVVVVLPTLVGLPVSALARQRAIDVGLTTNPWGDWALDVALATGITALQTAIGFVVLVALMRRFPDRWWIQGSLLVTAAAALITFAGPVVVDPLFNAYTPVQGQVRDDVLALADRAGVDAGGVYVVDASRRTTAANAYVGGLVGSRRIVLYDTLLERFPPAQQRSVVAHELGHARYDDLPRGLLFVLLVAPAGLFAVARITRILAPPGTDRRPGASTVPALAVAFALVLPVVTTVSNQLSRRVEARADTFALQLTDDPAALIAFQRDLAVRNLSDPDPPAWRQWWRGTHPTTLQRIGIGTAWARGERP